MQEYFVTFLNIIVPRHPNSDMWVLDSRCIAFLLYMTNVTTAACGNLYAMFYVTKTETKYTKKNVV